MMTRKMKRKMMKVKVMNDRMILFNGRCEKVFTSPLHVHEEYITF